MTSKPGTWGYKPSRARRAANSAAENLKARAKARARQASAKLRGHTSTCKDCGKTFRSEHQRNVHNIREHEKKGRTRAEAPRRRGRYGNCCGKSFHSDAQQKEHMLRHQEKDDRARAREQERRRRTNATRTRAQRNGRPAAPPRGRTRNPMQEKARRTLQANGRLDQNGQRIPYEPHPKLRPRTQRPPKVHT